MLGIVFCFFRFLYLHFRKMFGEKKKKKGCMCPLDIHLFLLLVLSLTLQAALSDLHFALGVVVSAGGEQAPTEGEL